MSDRIAEGADKVLIFAHADSLYKIDEHRKINIPYGEIVFQNKYNCTIWFLPIYDAHEDLYSLYYLKRWTEDGQKKLSRNLFQFKSSGEKILNKSVEEIAQLYQFTDIAMVHPFQIVGIDGNTGEVCFVDL